MNNDHCQSNSEIIQRVIKWTKLNKQDLSSIHFNHQVYLDDGKMCIQIYCKNKYYIVKSDIRPSNKNILSLMTELHDIINLVNNNGFIWENIKI